ncbi:hypothetical protein M2323_003038 [Rhodoblastus acidophilus]|uniref:hypothetical protein n=1 Tax=Rhodoblastus acidophilus TaxID=1074 RepID=UPI002225A981|nr:hypothetical protein [Rhodoblastus acidophilus]MCW2285144.1 hypothetical protein [Rhodoblastus acidophilus]MCW2334098.1 hypothetical protein [Rhodoblastus acidophilus]
MTLPLVSPLLTGLINIAREKYKAENEAWVQLSLLLSGRFNLDAALISLQWQGEVDILLRCLEDEINIKSNASEPDFSSHYLLMLSETWVVGCYEILRAFYQRDRDAAKAGMPKSGVSDIDEFRLIFNEFEILRMPMAKYEIAKDYELKHPLPMWGVDDDESKPPEFYDPKDPSRFHIMPRGLSPRGSARWLAFDVRNSRQHGVERRDLADRLLSLLKSVKGAGELEAEQNAASQDLARLGR